MIQVKQGAKTCRYTQARLRGQLFHKQFSGLQIATLAFQHLLLSESLLVSSALLRVYLCRFLQAMHGHNVLYNVATTLLSSFGIRDLLCGFSQLKLCDIIFIPDTQPPSAPALLIFTLQDYADKLCTKSSGGAPRMVSNLFSFLIPIGLLQLCLVFCQKCGFFKLPQFLYTHLLTLVLLTNNGFRVSSLYMFLRYATGL